MSQRNPATIFYLIQGLSSFAFALIFTTNLIYQAEVVGLNPLQLVLVGTTLEAVAFFFEIPTGVVADVYSRRLSVIIGFFMVGVGFIIEGSLPFFWAILLNQVIWGIGITFTSGALEAWIADEAGETQLGRILLRGSQIGSIAGIGGILLSGLLGSVALALPVIVGGGLFILLTILMILFMKETGFRAAPRGERSTFGSMVRTTRDAIAAVRLRPILAIFLLIAIFAGAHSEGFDRLWREHMMENFTFPAIGDLQPVMWFSLIGLANMALVTILTELLRRRVDTNNQKLVARVVQGITIAQVAGLVVFSLSGNFAVALISVLAVQSMRSVSGPLVDTWQNQHIDSSVRATVISSLHQFDALGQVGGGPLVGLIGLRLGLRAAIGTTAILLAPVVWLVGRASTHDSTGKPAAFQPPNPPSIT